MASEVESLETASTSLAEDSLSISFEDITYTVRSGLRRARKVILNNISGQFNAGELTVIIGQSGAGKSSLMDILTGYTKPTSGNLYINGRVRNEKKFRRRSCYILQDDRIQEQLTIEESLNMAAEFKLGDHINKQLKEKRVKEIITSLGLDVVRNTRAGVLSGGQKKRLAIGLELVSDPPIMFLDEPISGLDSSIAKQIVCLLHLLARQGRTVVVSMHQPSAALLQMVDRVYAVSEGQCIYMGSVPFLLPYLERLDMTCPPYHNPVDFLLEQSMETISREQRSTAKIREKLVESSNNGKNKDWIPNIIHETDLEINNVYKCDLTSLPPPKEDPTNKIVLAIKSTYSTSRWQQFLTLTKRSLLTTWRDPQFTLTIIGIHCAMALFVGTLFYKIGNEAAYVQDNYNFLYFSLMFLMFTAFSAVSINFPEQLPVVRREHFNRWYTTSAYYSSTLVSTLPTQTACTLLYACIVYFMTGQPMEFYRFFQFTATLLAVSYVALYLGLLNGSMFDAKHGVIFGPIFIMPFTIFSGFFLRYSDAPKFFHWVFHISFLKHGLVSLLITIFGNNWDGHSRPKFPCYDDTLESIAKCYYRNPKQFLLDHDIMKKMYNETSGKETIEMIESLTTVVTSLLGISFVVIVCAYVILRIRLKGKR